MKEKLKQLLRYKQSLLDRQSSPVPEKHKNHVDTFKHFLDNEIRMVTIAIDKLTLGDK